MDILVGRWGGGGGGDRFKLIIWKNASQLNYKNMRFENIVREEMEDCFYLFICVFFFPTSILYSCVFAQSVMVCMYLTMQTEYRQNNSIKY